MERSISYPLFIQFSLSLVGFLLLVNMFPEQSTRMAKVRTPMAHWSHVN